MALDPITALLDFGSKVIERIFPDPSQAAQAKLEEIAPDGNLYAVNSEDTGELTFVDEATFNELIASAK